jgi:hypothetical protein
MAMKMKMSSMKAKKMASMKMGMKKMASMKMGMKRMAMKVSKIAKGKRSKLVVFNGNKEKTSGGLAKKDLKKNKNGKIVSVKQSARGKKAYSKYLAGWNAAVQKARKALGVKGFQAVGGKSKAGQALLAKARSFYKK